MARRTLQSIDATAELLWKWLLRLLGVGAFIYVLVGLHGNVPAAIYFLIGGFVGLPSIIGWQKAVRDAMGED